MYLCSPVICLGDQSSAKAERILAARTHRLLREWMGIYLCAICIYSSSPIAFLKVQDMVIIYPVCKSYGNFCLPRFDCQRR